MNDSSLVGSKLGKYQIQAEIGRGGMGAVYKGYDPLLDRYVAMKVLAPHLVWQEGFVERFLREARSAARLQHPNIVTIYDVGQEGNWYYYVMEYLRGQTLTDLIRERGPLSSGETLSILRPLADALDHAHQTGLVHRDVKPANVIVGQAGRVSLTDFGIARAAQETGLTATGTVIGTPEYMSPEQVRGLPADACSDQYSLAVVAYEMLSGQVPFQADNTLALMYKVANDPPPPLRESRPDLPAGVGDALERALAKEPRDRYPKVETFVETLSQALAGKRIKVAGPRAAAPPVEPATVLMGQKVVVAPPEARPKTPRPRTPVPKAAPSTPKPSPAPIPVRRRVPGWVWGVGALAVLLLAVGLAMALGGGGGDKMPTTAPTSIAVVPTEPAATTLVAAPVETPDEPTTTLAATSTLNSASTDVPLSTSTQKPMPTETEPPVLTSTRAPSRTPTERPATSTQAPTNTTAPTATSTRAPRPTDTPQPDPTRTPTQSAQFAAPILVDPPNNKDFSQSDRVVLSWQAVGALPADAYYQPVVAYSHGGETWYDETPWTKDTTWTLSEHGYLLDLSDDGRFRWSVRVMQRTGTDAGGKPKGTPLSPASEEWVLVWRVTGGGGEGGGSGGAPTLAPP